MITNQHQTQGQLWGEPYTRGESIFLPGSADQSYLMMKLMPSKDRPKTSVEVAQSLGQLMQGNRQTPIRATQQSHSSMIAGNRISPVSVLSDLASNLNTVSPHRPTAKNAPAPRKKEDFQHLCRGIKASEHHLAWSRMPPKKRHLLKHTVNITQASSSALNAASMLQRMASLDSQDGSNDSVKTAPVRPQPRRFVRVSTGKSSDGKTTVPVEKFVPVEKAGPVRERALSLLCEAAFIVDVHPTEASLIVH